MRVEFRTGRNPYVKSARGESAQGAAPGAAHTVNRSLHQGFGETRKMEETCDVFVLGGGPAGSAAAGLLAERGWKTVVVDKERHPRFHIGESMLPMSTPLFERPRRARAGREDRHGEVRRRVLSRHRWKQTVTFDFQPGVERRLSVDLPGAPLAARRDPVPQQRQDGRADGRGVPHHRRAIPQDADVRIAGEMADGTKRSWRARFFIDASGRDTFLSRRFDMKRRNHDHATAAMFGHFVNAKRLPGREEGNISIFWFEHGWFWFIPLLDGQTSVGAVCNADYMKTRKGDTRQFFFDTIAPLPGARGAPRAGAAARQRHRHRQLLLLLGSHVRRRATSWSATPGRSSTRCSPRACCSA